MVEGLVARAVVEGLAAREGVEGVAVRAAAARSLCQRGAGRAAPAAGEAAVASAAVEELPVLASCNPDRYRILMPPIHSRERLARVPIEEGDRLFDSCVSARKSLRGEASVACTHGLIKQGLLTTG